MVIPWGSSGEYAGRATETFISILPLLESYCREMHINSSSFEIVSYQFLFDLYSKETITIMANIFIGLTKSNISLYSIKIISQIFKVRSCCERQPPSPVRKIQTSHHVRTKKNEKGQQEFSCILKLSLLDLIREILQVKGLSDFQFFFFNSTT